MMVGDEEIAQANCQMFFELLENDEAQAALAHMMQTGKFEDVKFTILMPKFHGVYVEESLQRWQKRNKTPHYIG